MSTTQEIAKAALACIWHLEEAQKITGKPNPYLNDIMAGLKLLEPIANGKAHIIEIPPGYFCMVYKPSDDQDRQPIGKWP